ncbi:hypothetical protein F5Y12DRAFT_768795 [Xylaria sp. FL1777]|nr:hypothetical protein F5Y12DRAFT_768795 [Xylaria sp. FL1777]
MTSLNESFDVTSSNTKHLKRGGLRHLERFLGLRLDNALSIGTDAVFISLDLEVGSDRQRLHLFTDEPVITQVSFARLDIRDFASLSASSNLESLISVHMYKIEVPPKSKKAARKQERSCIFTHTQRIRRDKVPTILMQNLRIKNINLRPNSTASDQLRGIILIGHSIREDLKILRLLGINISTIAPIVAIIDTHTLSRFVLPPHHPNVPTLPGQDFSLRGVLAQLGCRPPIETFHNAGNDAVYSLLAMLLLAVRNSTARKAELSAGELVNLHRIKHAVSQMQMHHALAGMDTQCLNLNSNSPVTLGAGLRELALLYRSS